MGRKKGRIFLLVVLSGTLLISLLLFLALPLIAYVYFQLYGIIVPGVRVGDLELGGLTWQEAKDGLDLVYGVDPDLILTDGERNWITKASEFGLAWDTAAMAQQAANVGHGKDFLTEVSEIVESFRYGWEIEQDLGFDLTAAHRGLLDWEPNVLTAPINATLNLTGDQLIITPSQLGSGLDFDASLAAITQNPELIMEQGLLHFVTESISPDIPSVHDLADELENFMSQEITVRAFDPIRDDEYEWTLERGDIASWFIIEEREDGPIFTIDGTAILRSVESLMNTLDEGQFLIQETLAAEIEDALYENEEINIRVFHHPTTYLVQEGDTLLKLGWRMRMPYWMIMEANPETYSLGLQTGQTLTIPSLDDQLPLPVVRDKRIVMSISEQRLRTYENGQLMDEYIISTGIDRSPTQPGVFQIQTHELNAYASVWDLYMPHFLGIYEAWPDFMNGLHGLPTLSNGRRLWADILGKPASFGCIILDLDAAEALFEWADEGVVVEILE